jgi:hypothetical protein
VRASSNERAPAVGFGFFAAELDYSQRVDHSSYRRAENATPEYIDCFNRRRLHSEIGMIPLFELGDIYHHNQPVPTPLDAVLASL